MAPFLVSSIAAAFVIFSLAVHFPKCDKRRYRLAENYGKELLGSLPQNTILITGSADPLFISWYLQICEGYRPDVKVITRNGMIRPGYLYQVRAQHPEMNVPVEFAVDSVPERTAPDNVKEDLPLYAQSYFKRFCKLNCQKFPIFWEGLEARLLIDHFVPQKFAFQVLPTLSGVSVNSVLLDVEQVSGEIQGDAPAAKVYGNHFMNYGAYYQLWREPKKALQFYQDALKLNPSDLRSLNNAGGLLWEEGKKEQALALFSNAFHSNPNDAVSNHNMGQALLEQGQVRQALPYFQRAAKFGSSFEDHYDLGLCYAAMGKTKAAEKSLLMSLRLNPNSPEALSSLGVIYLRQQNLKQAEPLLQAAVTIDSTNAENWYNLACLNKLNGNNEESSRNLNKALSLDPTKTTELASRDAQMRPLLESLVRWQ